MFSRAAVRATTQVAGRRGFHATRSQMSSPYHYPEGPYTNIPFNPKAKTFPLLFWGFCAAGFGAPFLIASALYGILTPAKAFSAVLIPVFLFSVANLQAQGIRNESIRSGDHAWLIRLAMMDYRRKSRAKLWADRFDNRHLSNPIRFVSRNLMVFGRRLARTFILVKVICT